MKRHALDPADDPNAVDAVLRELLAEDYQALIGGEAPEAVDALPEALLDDDGPGGEGPEAGRRKHREAEEYDALLRRLSRIEGQVRGVRGMVEREAYCTDILTQVSAVQSALNAFARELLGSHIRTCVVRDIQAGQLEVVDDLLSAVQKLMK